ncbi:MAG: RNA polymerase sigma factor [Alphaproteobacteria bacterium]
MTDRRKTDKETAPVFTAERLAASFQAPLRRYFLRQGIASGDVGDLVQEVFVRILRRGEMSTLDNPQGYVFQTAANLLKDNARRNVTRSAHLHDSYEPESVISETPSQHRVLEARDDLARIKAVILAMPEKPRTVFILSRFESLKYREIAELMSISVSSVEKHMMFALKRISKSREKL